MSGQHHTVAALHPEMTLYQFYRRLSNIIKLLKYKRVFYGSCDTCEKSKVLVGKPKEKRVRHRRGDNIKYFLSK
jgi:hypothetical protein